MGAKLSNLPDGVSVERGRIEVRFDGAEDALARLYTLAQALGNDQAACRGRWSPAVDEHAQQIAGHASPKTTKLYDRDGRYGDRRRDRAYRNLTTTFFGHPRNFHPSVLSRSSWDPPPVGRDPRDAVHGRPRSRTSWTGREKPSPICGFRPRSRTCAASALAILEYARAHDFRIDDFIEATASGQASEKRWRLDELTSVVQLGDRLVVSELSRLGRSLGQIVTILDALVKAGVAFVALKENIRVVAREKPPIHEPDHD